MFRQILREEAEKLGLKLPPDTAQAGMELHFHLLKKWNARVNLTSIRDDREMVRRHFLESIQAAPFLQEVGPILDFGSGNGFPGVPLELLHQGKLMVLDASRKKCSFLKELFRQLEWEVSGVIHRRVNHASDLQDLGRFQYLTARAVSLTPELLSGLPDILRPGGLALFFVGEKQVPGIEEMVGGQARVQKIPLQGRKNACLAVVRVQNVPRGTFPVDQPPS